MPELRQESIVAIFFVAVLWAKVPALWGACSIMFDSLKTGGILTGCLVILFGVPLIPGYIIWWLVQPASDWAAIATIFLCICTYIPSWFLVLLILVVLLETR